MTTRILGSVTAIVLSLAAALVVADEGKVIAAVGQVDLVRDGKEARLERGALVRSGDLIRVGADSAAQIRLSDESIVALSPRTEFLISDYRFSAEKPAEGRAVFSLIKGALRTITGIIGVRARENYRLNTVVATIGIRGTHYRARLCANDCPAEARDGLYGGVTDGRIGVTNDTGTEEFGVDEYFFLADMTTRPERLPGPPELLIDRLNVLAKLKRDGAAPSAALPASVAAPELARAGPALSALESLSSLSTQQFRPAELTGSTNELVHSTPLQPITGGTFASLGGSGDIRGQIVWMTNADIDLKSLVPDGTLVYFANRTATLAPGTTAQLDHDNLGGVIDVAPDKRVENISVTGPNIPAGSYAFFAHSFSGNNGGLPTTVQIRVTGDGNRTAITDSVTLSEDAYSNKYIVDYKGSAVAPTYRVAPQ